MPSAKKISCRIKDLHPDPKISGRTLVSVELDDGAGPGPWHQVFSLEHSKLWTIDEFLKTLYQQDLERPEDPIKPLKEAMEAGKVFELNLTAKIEPAGEN